MIVVDKDNSWTLLVAGVIQVFYILSEFEKCCTSSNIYNCELVYVFFLALSVFDASIVKLYCLICTHLESLRVFVGLIILS